MNFLSLYGTDGFRTFLGVLNGKLAYTPAKIPQINPEILTERIFDLRLDAVISPYMDNHPALKNILPIISSNIGTLQFSSPKYSVWNPKYHLSYLSQLLLASLQEEFLNNQISEISFIATQDDNGEAFAKAFSLEKKIIYIPQDQPIPIFDSNTTVKTYDSKDTTFVKNIRQQFSFLTDQHNIFRIIGHMATIIEAIYQTEATRQRFYNDPISLVIPGDSMEYVLAAYYLSKSTFPIKTIHVISHQHRMIHQFLQKGELQVSQKQLFESFEFSLDRMLFELARGSAEKLVLWKKELSNKGVFKIDSTAQKGLSIFQSHMAIPRICEQIQATLETPTASKIELYTHHLAQSSNEYILGLNLSEH